MENPKESKMCLCTLNTGEVIKSRYIICSNLGIEYFEKVVNTGKYVVDWHYIEEGKEKQMKYRSDVLFGEGYRDFVDVCTHETYELGNRDIIDGLKDGLLQHSYLYDKLQKLSEEYQVNGYIGDMSETDWKQFFTECKEEIARIYNIQPNYVLWLADSYEAVKSYVLHEEVTPENVDCYEESEYVITNLGYETELFDAIANGDIEKVKYFVNKVADIAEKRFIILAADCGSLEIIQCLVENGADVTAEDNFAICRAAYYGYLDIVQYLHEHGADVAAQDNRPIISAVKSGSIEVVKYLVENGADVTIANNVPIVIASDNNRLDIVRYLVEHGADVTARNNRSICIAVSNGYLDLVRYLVEHGADVTVNDNEPITTAKTNEDLEMVKYLEQCIEEQRLEEQLTEEEITTVEFLAKLKEQLSIGYLKEQYPESDIEKMLKIISAIEEHDTDKFVDAIDSMKLNDMSIF